MRNVYTVKQVNAYIKNMFTQDFMLNRIYVKGEVSNCKYHTSGHIYFTLKDESGTIACVMFAGHRSGLSFRMQEGQQIVVLGSVSTYEREGKYQLYANEIRLDGEGVLYEKFKQLKEELEEMGMFSEVYKKPIPAYVKTVGVVTAPTGAAVRDIIQISKRRNPYVRIIVCPAKVQGEGAAQSIVRAIEQLSRQKIDVMIVGRGGGSMEDLWAFNEEIVARAVFDCEIPIISAVGHETDTTIIDYVSDLRAPTPSAAAELAVYDYYELQDRLEKYRIRLLRELKGQISQCRLMVQNRKSRLELYSPSYKIKDYRLRSDEYEEMVSKLMKDKLEQYKDELKDKKKRIEDGIHNKTVNNRHRLELLIQRMKGLSPLDKLNQGFSYVEDQDGKNIKSIGSVKKGDLITVRVTDGRIMANVVDAGKDQ